MTRKQFTVATEPHVAEVGEHEFLFQPELASDELLENYAELRTKLAALNVDAAENIEVADDPERGLAIVRAAKEFVAQMMLPKSAELYLKTSLPDRVTVEMMDWIVEVYTGRPTGPSNGSRAPSSRAGRRSTGSSHSKARTR